MVTEFSASQVSKQPTSLKPEEKVWHTSNSKSPFVEEINKKAEFKSNDEKGSLKAPKPGTKHIQTVKRTSWGLGRRRRRKQGELGPGLLVSSVV